MSDEGVNTSMEAVGADHVEYDGQSTIHGPEEVVSAEQLQLIKARTMYQMVEDIDGGSAGKRRIIFLTNAQAELIARQENAIGIKRLVQALEIMPPKLIINIISSWGFSEFSRQCPWWQGGGAKDWNLGMVHNRSPFVTLDEEKRARERIDAFMLDVIIPLAAKTNAVILCEAVKQVITSEPGILELAVAREHVHASGTRAHHTLSMAGVCGISQPTSLRFPGPSKMEWKITLYDPLCHF